MSDVEVIWSTWNGSEMTWYTFNRQLSDDEVRQGYRYLAENGPKPDFWPAPACVQAPAEGRPQ